VRPPEKPPTPPGHRPLPTLATLLPLIVFLEVALLIDGTDSSASRILAHTQIGNALSFFGLSPIFVMHATSLLVLTTLLSWHLLVRDRWSLSPAAPAQLFFEGVIGTAPLLAAAAFLGTLQAYPLSATALEPASIMDAVAIAIGASLSEELLFRMIGIAAVHWLLVDVMKTKAATGTIAAVLVTSVAFAMYHDPASLPAGGIAFVTLAGAYLGTLYVLRGFAVAVIAHAGYDVVVLLGQLSG
jgi:membrane protease YdiL (CAAX protease family)